MPAAFLPLKHVIDTETRHPVRDRRRGPAGNDGDIDAGPAQQLHAVTIPGIEDFVLAAFVVDDQSTIGQHAIDIEYDQAHSPRPFKDVLHGRGEGGLASDDTRAQQVVHVESAD